MWRSVANSETPLGTPPKKWMEGGKLVSNEIFMAFVKEGLPETVAIMGGLFDGFPRTLNQAEALRKDGIHIDHIIEINVDDRDIIERMSGRRVHLTSGRTYHVRFNPPKREGFDDETGEPLIQREDGHEYTVKKRLEVYHAQTAPLIAYYTSLSQNGATDHPRYYKIEGTGKVEEIRDRILEVLLA